MKRLLAALTIMLALTVVGTFCVSVVAPATVEAGCRGDKC